MPKLRVLIILVLGSVLSSCGGGGGSGSPAAVNPPPPNQAPTANAGADQIVDEGATVTLVGAGADSDGTIVSYIWQQESGVTVVISSPDTANASFEAPMVSASEELVFRLTVTDDDGATGADTVLVTVNDVSPPNTAPIVTVDQPADGVIFNSNDTIILIGTATDAEDGALSPNIRWSSDQDGNLGTGATLSASLSIGTHILTASVTDSGGISVSETITITVDPQFEVTFTFPGGRIFGHMPVPQSDGFDYYFTPLVLDTSILGDVITIESIDVSAFGQNNGDVVNFDWEVHIGPTPFGLPEGQFIQTLVDPIAGYTRTAPTQFRFAIGNQLDTESYLFSGQHNFVTRTTTADPYLSTVHEVFTAPTTLTEGLYAQVFLWTADNRNSQIDFGEITLTVRGQTSDSSSEWMPGVFLDADIFYAQCELPRNGINPATGSPFPDVQGTTTDENNFLRSFSNDTYLWYSEIIDRDPSLIDDTLAYFDLLRTTEPTPSGAPKDKFHFTYDTDEWYRLSQSGVSAGYGAVWALLAVSPPREIVVAYTEPNSPAVAPAVNLVRGEEIISVDGVAVVDGDAAVLNSAFWPDAAGETHTFVVHNPDTMTNRTVTMTSEIITSAPVQGVDIINTPTGDVVGYMVFNDHIATAEQALIDAVNQLNASDGGQGIDDLVLDIRYNGGGYLAIASQFAYMIAGNAATAGRTFELLQFNDKHPVTNPITGRAISPTPFYSQTLGPPFNGGAAGQPLPTLDLPRVFVLTGSGTCSASEAIMNSLRGVDVEVIQIGSTTCGKPYGFYPQDNCGTTYFTIQFRGVNEKNFGDYTDGFSPDNTPANQAGTVVPGCSVADDFSKQLGDPTEERLAVALAYRDGSACPAASGLAPDALNKSGTPSTSAEVKSQEVIVPKSPWHTNRIMRP
jgi:C-terminal processing protease CtpA/Prc